MCLTWRRLEASFGLKTKNSNASWLVKRVSRETNARNLHSPVPRRHKTIGIQVNSAPLKKKDANGLGLRICR